MYKDSLAERGRRKSQKENISLTHNMFGAPVGHYPLLCKVMEPF